MEKILLKPSAKEILLKGSAKEGHLDIFSYNYDSDENRKKLGSLFIVGNIHPALAGKDEVRDTDESPAESSDVAYVTNLVASLAKREYYANTDLSPKEAFSSTLKKVNDVIEEFFKNKNEVRINIGIFAVAGESIHISKLGKFKIFLARDNKNIDILNNIQLFTKEKIEQEHEFSHVISGKIYSGDKILAFYPGRYVTAREKYLKDYFLKFKLDQFVEKINGIKEEKPDFACAALYINLNTVREPALEKKPEIAPIPEMAGEMAGETAPLLAAEINPPQNDQSKEIRRSYINNEPPRIIRSEFALGKKVNPLLAVFKKIRPFIPKRQNKMVFFASLLAVVLASALIVKSVFFVSPGSREAANAVSAAQTNIKLAKTKISQNDLLEARRLLTASMLSLGSLDPSKSADVKDQISKILDGIDQAVTASPALVDSLPKELAARASQITSEEDKLRTGKYAGFSSGVISADIYQDNLYILTPDTILKITDVSKKNKGPQKWLKDGLTLAANPLLTAVDGKVYVLNKSGVLTTYYKGDKSGEVNTLVLPDEQSVLLTTANSTNLYLVNKKMGRIYLIDKAAGAVSKTIKIGSDQPIANAYLSDKEEIYISTQDGKIWKIQ